jgi:hypothetical protein
MLVRSAVITALLVSLASPAHAQTEPPTVVVSTLRSLVGPLVFTFSRDVGPITEDNVRVTISGGAPVAGRRACAGSSGPVPCSGSSVRTVAFRPTVPFVTGETYDALVNPEGAAPQVTDGITAVGSYKRVLRAPTGAEENSPGITYRWGRVKADAAGGGQYVRERQAGARAIYRFTGTSVRWITTLAPEHGVAKIFIDGAAVATVDTYASSRRYRVAKTFSGLADRAHTLVVRVEGRAGRGSGAWVAVDGFRTAAGIVDETAGRYAWRVVRDAKASGDAYATTPSVGAVATFVFRGRAAEWYTHTGPDQGIAKIFVDGKYIRSFDNYSSTRRYAVRRAIMNLSDTQHQLQIVVTGGKNRASRGTLVRLDAFALRAPTTAFRGLGAWVDLFDYTDSTNPASQLDEMRSHGVKTLYLQTGRFTTSAFRYPTAVRAWLEGAHARNIKVVGWYLPRYDEPITAEVDKTVAIATYRSAGGHTFDGLGIDIEYRTDPDTNTHLKPSEFFAGITKHLRLVRSKVGVSFPIAAITFAPLDMDIWPGGWNGFPWSSVARYSDVAMPMSYWSNRYGRCDDGDTRYCVTGYTRENIVRTRALTGLPVHIIGGVMTHARIGPSTVRAFVDASKAERAYGASLYDARSTDDGEWVEARRANQL